MFTSDQYELLDFGRGRKLERFGCRIVDRPSPAAEHQQPNDPVAWSTAVAKFQRRTGQEGIWRPRQSTKTQWHVQHGQLMFALRANEFGHVGLFPEQASNWDWIIKQIRRAGRPMKVLNLFAYTGASTLAAAAAGAEVVHVDAARNTVAWARENARLSDLDQSPIRWITEDAAKFVDRELKRGNEYDAVILDPPSYGHGPKSEVWKLTSGLAPLIRNCGKLTAKRRAFFLLTCHTPGYGPAELSAILADTLWGHCQAGVHAASMSLQTANGRRLRAGALARWPN